MRSVRAFTKLFRSGIIALVMVLPACSTATISVTPVPTLTAIPPSKHRIAFDSDSSTYLINADGTDLMQLVKRGGGPVWSPDGQFIAFGNGQVYIVNANGGKPVLIAKDDSSLTLSSIVWSPNGKQIAFAVNGGGGNGRIYIVEVEKVFQNRENNSFRQVNRIDGIDANGLNWSPDGQYLAFYAREEIHDSYKVFAMDVSSEKLTILVFGAWSPAWSPDGKQMVVVSGSQWKGDITIIEDAAQAIQKFKLGYPRLTHNDADDESPVWSPDGQHIAFISNRDGNQEIYTMAADGSHQTRLTDNPADDLQPAWSPDGKQIAFVSQRDGNWEIYVMNADGSHLLRLTNNTVDDFNPVWQPQPKP